jgi:hypothetical protein
MDFVNQNQPQRVIPVRGTVLATAKCGIHDNGSSAITGGQRGNVGMIRRMTKVERLRGSSTATATAGEAKAGSRDAWATIIVIV